MSENKNKTSLGMEQNLEGLLCYVGWWVTGIIFYIMEKENKFVRFHAVQSIVVFGAYTVIAVILSIIINLMSFFGGFFAGFLLFIIWVLAIILWVILMMKAYQGQMYKLPIAGDIADKNSNPVATTNQSGTASKPPETAAKPPETPAKPPEADKKP
jgi:uncharacterized membrane protein